MYLFTAAPADSSSVLDASPQLVSLLEETGKLLPPVFAQCPRKNLILTLLLILLHGVGKIPTDGAHEPNSESLTVLPEVAVKAVAHKVHFL